MGSAQRRLLATRRNRPIYRILLDINYRRNPTLASMKKKTTVPAFTLIELLVVITIIAILASFVLPAYTAVQERAQQTKDLSNAKQIALALKQFAADNNGAFPSKAPGADFIVGDAGGGLDRNQRLQRCVLVALSELSAK